MARIEGVDLPAGKRIEYALPYVFGLGLKLSRDILRKLNISFDKRVKDLTEEEVVAIQKEVSSSYITEGDLRKKERLDVRRLVDIKSYRGLRHKAGLPVHGQRTKTNARSRKGPRGQAIAKKKAPGKK